MTKHWKPYALHILDCIHKIKDIQERGDITNDVILYDAALRNLPTMSEATRHLPEEKIKDYPDIPWADISGFRNILVHDYLGEIDAETILNIIQVHVGRLQDAVSDMVNKSSK